MKFGGLVMTTIQVSFVILCFLGLFGLLGLFWFFRLLWLFFLLFRRLIPIMPRLLMLRLLVMLLHVFPVWVLMHFMVLLFVIDIMMINIWMVRARFGITTTGNADWDTEAVLVLALALLLFLLLFLLWFLLAKLHIILLLLLFVLAMHFFAVIHDTADAEAYNNEGNYQANRGVATSAAARAWAFTRIVLDFNFSLRFRFRCLAFIFRAFWLIRQKTLRFFEVWKKLKILNSW